MPALFPLAGVGFFGAPPAVVDVVVFKVADDDDNDDDADADRIDCTDVVVGRQCRLAESRSNKRSGKNGGNLYAANEVAADVTAAEAAWRGQVSGCGRGWGR